MTELDAMDECNDPSCLICQPLVTRTGKVMTDAVIEVLATEADLGYDVDELVERRRNL